MNRFLTRFTALAVGIAALLALPAAFSAETSLYAEPHRPQYHFTPEINWMNDPNGMVYYDGEYHLFYQYNPFGNKWGHMSWGHAVSEDLVAWTHLPIAIPENDGVMAFSGSAVIDWKNTSGFGDGKTPPMVAIYTGHIPETKRQAQYIAYSNDRGRTWKTYKGNPVLDRGLADFRDPKVFWFEKAGYWVMTVALPTEHKVAFYRSDDLRRWTLLSEFGPAASTGGIWECPDLFPLTIVGETGTTKWVLIVSIGDGAVNGGSGCQYFVGDFNGTTFTADTRDGIVPTRWADYGRDFYAPVSWSDVPVTDGRRLWLGWLSNWKYAQETPTHPWRSAQSLVRELQLVRDRDGLRLVQHPVAEYVSLRTEPHVLPPRTIPAGQLDLASYGIKGDVLELKLVLSPGSAAEAGLIVAAGPGHATRIGYDVARGVLFVDRTKSGPSFHENFAGRHEAPVALSDGKLALHVFLDRSTLEVFAAGGRVVISDQIFPPEGHNGVQLYAVGGDAHLAGLQAWPLKSIWHAEQAMGRKAAAAFLLPADHLVHAPRPHALAPLNPLP